MSSGGVPIRARVGIVLLSALSEAGRFEMLALGVVLNVAAPIDFSFALAAVDHAQTGGAGGGRRRERRHGALGAVHSRRLESDETDER